MAANNPRAWHMDETPEQAAQMARELPTVQHQSGVHIARTAYIDPRAPITLGWGVTICDWCKLLTHDYSPVRIKKQPETVEGITIGNSVFIGIAAIILPGVTIGDNVIVGAGAVVSKDLPSNAVYAGNPVIKIKDL